MKNLSTVKRAAAFCCAAMLTLSMTGCGLDMDGLLQLRDDSTKESKTTSSSTYSAISSTNTTAENPTSHTSVTESTPQPSTSPVTANTTTATTSKTTTKPTTKPTSSTANKATSLKTGCYAGRTDIPDTYAYITLRPDKTVRLEANFGLDSIRKVEPYCWEGTYSYSPMSGGTVINLYFNGELYWYYFVGNTGDFFQDDCVVFRYTGATDTSGDILTANQALQTAKEMVGLYNKYTYLGVCCDVEYDDRDLSQFVSEDQKSDYFYYQYRCTCCSTVRKVIEHIASVMDGSLMHRNTEELLFTDNNGNVYLIVGPMGFGGYDDIVIVENKVHKIVARADVYDLDTWVGSDYFTLMKVDGNFKIIDKWCA